MDGLIRPGQPWLDTSGRPIQAHGGSILALEGAFFWYGENKERTTGRDGLWHWGVRCYTSTDLATWEDLGLIIPPDLDDPSSPLHPTQLLDRPHIIVNPTSGKYVSWLRVSSRAGRPQRLVALEADALLGPYTIVEPGARLLGMDAGDFDVVVDLSFRPQRFHYLISSGTTWYFPNPSEIAIAETYHGPWRSLGDPHPSDVTRTSFRSQISSVFKHPGKQDLYVALADRWLPELPDDAPHATDVIATHSASDAARLLAPYGYGADPDTSRADYVWLPFRFNGDMPYLDWVPEWRVDDFS